MFSNGETDRNMIRQWDEKTKEIKKDIKIKDKKDLLPAMKLSG